MAERLKKGKDQMFQKGLQEHLVGLNKMGYKVYLGFKSSSKASLSTKITSTSSICSLLFN